MSSEHTTPEATPLPARCGHNGGTGLGAGHACTCTRPAGHPLDSGRPHGCPCMAMWADYPSGYQDLGSIPTVPIQPGQYLLDNTTAAPVPLGAPDLGVVPAPATTLDLIKASGCTAQWGPQTPYGHTCHCIVEDHVTDAHTCTCGRIWDDTGANVLGAAEWLSNEGRWVPTTPEPPFEITVKGGWEQFQPLPGRCICRWEESETIGSGWVRTFRVADPRCTATHDDGGDLQDDPVAFVANHPAMPAPALLDQLEDGSEARAEDLLRAMHAQASGHDSGRGECVCPLCAALNRAGLTYAGENPALSLLGLLQSLQRKVAELEDDNAGMAAAGMLLEATVKRHNLTTDVIEATGAPYQGAVPARPQDGGGWVPNTELQIEAMAQSIYESFLPTRYWANADASTLAAYRERARDAITAWGRPEAALRKAEARRARTGGKDTPRTTRTEGTTP